MLVRSTKKMGRLLALVLAVAMMVSVFCVNASAAGYNSKTGSLRGYSCTTTVSFATSSSAVNGTTSYGTTADKITISLYYTFIRASDLSSDHVSASYTGRNCSSLTKTLSAGTSVNRNVSGHGSGTVTAIDGPTWQSGVLYIS